MVVFLISHNALAQQRVVLSALELDNSYIGIDYSGQFSDISGKIWDTSSLYKNKNFLELSGGISFNYFDGKIVHSINSSFDLGKTSDALSASPIIGFGYGRTIYLREQLILQWSIKNLFQIGGRLSQSPCMDDFQRSFHCGTAVPWAIAKPTLSDKNKLPIVIYANLIKFF